MPKIQMDEEVNVSDVVVGFPIPKAGRVPCQVGLPKLMTSKKDKPMFVFPLSPLENVACITVDDSGEKEVMTGKGRAILQYFGSLSSGAVKNGSIAKIENACQLPKSIHSGLLSDVYTNIDRIVADVLPQFAGKQVIAIVTNRTGDNGRLQANVNDLFKM